MSSISKNKSLKAALALTEDRTVRKLLILYFLRGSRERMGITSLRRGSSSYAAGFSGIR